MKRIVLSCFAAIVATACNPRGNGVLDTPDAVNAVVTIRTLSLTGSAPVSGGTSQLTATASFSDGSSRNVTSLAQWSSSDAAVLTISSAGMATGIRGGHALAQASYGGLNGVLDLNIVIALPPPLNPQEVVNCEKQGDDASDIMRTLYIESYPRTTVSQVDLGFTSKNTRGNYSVKLEVLANKAKVGEKTVTILVEASRKLASASFVFTPALNIPQGASMRFVATLDAGPAGGELSWEGTTDSKCPAIVTPNNTSTDPIIGPKIPVRVLGS